MSFITLRVEKMKLFLNFMVDLSMHCIRSTPHSDQETFWWIMPFFYLEFHSLFWSENPRNIGLAFFAALRVQEFLVIEKEHNTGNFACDEGDDDGSCLDDHEL